MNKVFFVTLIFIAISTSSWSATLSKSDFREYGNQIHKIIKKYETAQIENDCIWGITFSDSEINYLPLKLLKAGLQPGDKVISVAGNNLSQTGLPLRELSITKGQPVQWKIIRNNKEENLLINCPFSRKHFLKIHNKIGYQMKKDKPKECLKTLRNSIDKYRFRNFYFFVYEKCLNRHYEKTRIRKSSSEQYHYDLYKFHVGRLRHDFLRFSMYENIKHIEPEVEVLVDKLIPIIRQFKNNNYHEYAMQLRTLLALRIAKYPSLTILLP